MVYEYSAETTPLQPARLGSAEFRAIGRIIRSCAEIEDCITLFIVKLLDTPEGNVWVLLGQTPISKKLSIAAYLAKMRADDLTTIFEASWTDQCDRLIGCRNAVAHGVLLGRSLEGRWAFLTAKTEGALPNTAVQVVISYTTSDLQKHAYAGEIFANLLAERLGLKELLAKRIGKPLQPHRKAGRKKATQGAKQKRPPRSSRA